MVSRIAVVQGADSESTQNLFSAVVADLRAGGVNVAGVIAEVSPLPDSICTAGLLRTVSGASHPIYLETAPSGTSCHLDANGVECACAKVLDDMRGCDLVVLSKFGKLEAGGGGLLPAFEAAIAAGTPILTTVSAKHREAWQAFAAHADLIAADMAAVKRWWRSAPRRNGMAPPEGEAGV